MSSEALDIEPYMPLDKSWMIRMGVLDLLYGDRGNTVAILDENEPLPDDLVALRNIMFDWGHQKSVNAGESATLYRILQFINWRDELDISIAREGTLKEDRKITSDPAIVDWPQAQLLTLDNHTSQWATAAVLYGDDERLEDPPFKLALTYQAWDEWHTAQELGIEWQPRNDSTLRQQALAFLAIKAGQESGFEPQQAEDYPFAYTFGYTSIEEGEQRWPNLVGHESNRFTECAQMLELAQSGEPVTSRDHRVVQAIAMWGIVNGTGVEFAHPDCVSKSWPLFWDFIARI